MSNDISAIKKFKTLHMYKEKERKKNERKDDEEDQNAISTLATCNQHYS